MKPLLSLRALCWLCAVLLAACNVPSTLDVDVAGGVRKADARLWVDGRERANNAPVAPGYYGGVLVECEGPISADHAADRHAGCKVVTFTSPAPGWIFPFDLAVEAVHHALGLRTAERAEIELATGSPDEATPLDANAIRVAIESARENAVAR